MKFLKFIIIIMTVFFMVGCNKANKVKVYKNDIPIYNENNAISIAELDNIYEKFNSGFGGNELFKYLMKKGINTYRFTNNGKSFLYTAVSVEGKGTLYIFLEKIDGEYGVSYLLLKNNKLLFTNDDFAVLK